MRIRAADDLGSPSGERTGELAEEQSVHAVGSPVLVTGGKQAIGHVRSAEPGRMQTL